MSRDFWMAIRQALLMAVDAIERELDIDRTSDARRFWKDNAPH
jgi:hypothetical protein